MRDNYCAVICEYNPLHTGHVHLIKKAAEITGCAKTICIMSGNFTQRGNFAVADKYTRAAWAIHAGADIVIELPAVFASAPAPDFAYGAIKTLAAVPNITHLCFGSESGDIEQLKDLQQSLAASDISAMLKGGSSYSGAFSKINPLFTSNNILAAEYLNAIKTLKSRIIPVTIKRSGAGFNSTDNTAESFCSATSVRQSIYSSQLQASRPHLPQYVYNDLESIYGKDAAYGKDIINKADERYFAMLAHTVLQNGDKYAHSAAYNSGGLSARLLSSIKNCGSTKELLDSVKSKHLPESKVSRYFTALLLGIKDSDIKKAKSQRPYLRILAVSRRSLPMLSAMGTKADLIARYSHYKGAAAKCVKFDILSTDIYAKLFWNKADCGINALDTKKLNDLSYGLQVIDTD